MLRIIVVSLAVMTAAAQTQLDLRTQTKSVDFASAVSTKPVKTGTDLPQTCSPGELFFKTNAPAGANLYGCPAANAWSVQGGIASTDCWYDAANSTLKCADGAGNVYAAVKTGSAPTANQWVDYIAPTGTPHTSQPTASAVGAVADPGANGLPYRTGLGASVPSSADEVSGVFFCEDTTFTSNYACNLNPAIKSYKAGSAYWFRARAGNTGAATINFNLLGPKTIVKQADQDLAAGDIKTGQWVMVIYDGSHMQMQSPPATGPISGVAKVFGRDGIVTPQNGDYTTAQVTENGNLYFTNARARAALSGGGPITFGSATGTFDCPTCLTTSTEADTDLNGSFPHLSVAKLLGRPLASTPPSDLQYLGWNNTAGRWEPKTLPGAPVNSIFGRSGAVTALAGDYTTAQIPESGNLYFTNARARAAFAGSGPIAFASASGTFDCPTCVTSSTAADTDLNGSFPHLTVVRLQGRPMAGAPPSNLQYLGWNSGANQWEPKTLPSPPVATVFGRTGAIAPQSGDYSFSQISGTADLSQLPAAALRADQGNTVTAGTQDFTRAAHTLPMKAGTVANLPSSCTLGEAYFATDAPAGANLYGCTTDATWSAQGLLAVKSGDVLVGKRNAVNYLTGVGLISVIADDGNQVNVLTGLDTAVVQTQSGEQSGLALLCVSAGGSGSNYSCAMNPSAAAYATGMVLHWIPDADGSGGSTTLDVDTLGPQPIRRGYGAEDPRPGDILAGRMYEIWYDGAGFRLPEGGVSDPGGNGVVYRSGAGVLAPATANNISAAFFCEAGGPTNAYACNLNPGIAAYGTGATYWFKANTRNTGAATVEFNSLGAKAIKKYSDLDLGEGDIKAGQWVMLTYDGAAMQMQSQAANPPAAGGSIASVFGRTGTVTAQGGDYTTAQVSESGNLYFTDARALAAVTWSSLTGKPSEYKPATHAAAHQNGGADEIATSTPAANAIPKAGGSGKLAQTWVDFTGYQTTLGFAPEDAAKKGQANGYAGLDSGGKVPVSQLPAAASGALSFALTMTANNGVNGVETYSDGSSITWTCVSGSQCTGNWTPPAGASWVTVDVWAGGGAGAGSQAGTVASGGGGGGGYFTRRCVVTPGVAVAVAVGQGGISVGPSAIANGGDSSFGTCVAVVGGAGTNGNGANGGYLSGMTRGTGYQQNNSTAMLNQGYGSVGNSSAGPHALRLDGGGFGGGSATLAAAGPAGGTAQCGGGGGGAGGYNNATGGAGGASGCGGNGGSGGGWTSGGGYVACTAGTVPGGGGGGAGVETAGGASHNSCAGARGEIRVYYSR